LEAIDKMLKSDFRSQMLKSDFGSQKSDFRPSTSKQLGSALVPIGRSGVFLKIPGAILKDPTTFSPCCEKELFRG